MKNYDVKEISYNKLYEELSDKQVTTSGDRVIIRNGFFSSNQNIKVFEGAVDLYFRIDKNAMLEIMDSVVKICTNLSSQNNFQKMIDTFNTVESEIDRYFNSNESENRLNFYMINGDNGFSEDVRICYMSQIKGKGIAECAEKTAVANNILLMLKEINLFNYNINYLNALVSINNSIPEGHAFLEFLRSNKNDEITHLIYDITNPEIVSFNGDYYKHPAVYLLNHNEYYDFINGNSFDNSKFILHEYYKTKEKREYFGFKIDNLKEIRNEYYKMTEEIPEYDFTSNDDGTRTNHRTLPTENKNIKR